MNCRVSIWCFGLPRENDPARVENQTRPLPRAILSRDRTPQRFNGCGRVAFPAPTKPQAPPSSMGLACRTVMKNRTISDIGRLSGD